MWRAWCWQGMKGGMKGQEDKQAGFRSTALAAPLGSAAFKG